MGVEGIADKWSADAGNRCRSSRVRLAWLKYRRRAGECWGCNRRLGSRRGIQKDRRFRGITNLPARRLGLEEFHRHPLAVSEHRGGELPAKDRAGIDVDPVGMNVGFAVPLWRVSVHAENLGAARS